MLRSILLPGLALVTILGGPGPASAASAYSPNCSIPSRIALTGADASGTADPIGQFVIVIRDVGNNPISNSLVTIDLASCGEVRLCASTPGIEVDCPTGRARAFTVTGGSVVFRLIGQADPALAAFGASSPCAQVTADGFPIGTVSVSLFDRDGAGLGPGDLSAVVEDLLSAQYWSRSDFDGSGELGPADLSVWLDAFFAAGSTAGCPGAVCPSP